MVRLITLTALAFSILAAVYVFYRYAITPSGTNLQSVNQFFDYSGIECHFSWDNSVSSGTGLAYALNGKLRITYSFVSGTKNYAINVVANKRHMHAWVLGNPHGVTGTLEQWMRNVDAPQFDNLRCSPWWFPNQSYFKDASGVDISQVTI